MAGGKHAACAPDASKLALRVRFGKGKPHTRRGFGTQAARAVHILEAGQRGRFAFADAKGWCVRADMDDNMPFTDAEATLESASSKN